MSRVKVLSFLFLASLVLVAFLSYSIYVLQAENSKLKSELQSLRGTYEALKAEYSKLNESYSLLFHKYGILNQSYYRLNQTYYTLIRDYTEISLEYQKALSNYIELAVSYGTLNRTYYELLENYTRLERQVEGYTTLLNEYEKLSQIYQLLMSNYTQLKESYDAVYAAFYKPLPSEEKVVPKVDELRQWLKEDKTDGTAYNEPDFVCGDYAVMLHLHAKVNRWDIGIVAVLGKLDGKNFNHVFNAMICQEGLVYVEPQNDEVFYGPIGTVYYHPGFGRIEVKDLIVIVLYDSA